MRSTNEGDQGLLGAFTYMRRAKRIDSPVTIFLMGNQGTNADDRVIDVLGKLVAQFGTDLIIAFAQMAIRSGEAFQVRDGFDIPNDDAVHDSNIQRAGWPKVHPPARFAFAATIRST